MTDYAHMYKEFDSKRLLELARSVRNILKRLPLQAAHPLRDQEEELVMKGMYATEELKNRGTEEPEEYYELQHLQDEIYLLADNAELLGG